MNSLVVGLFAAGIVLLLFEVITPGAILGIAGGVCMLVGCGVAFSVYGPMGGFLALAVAIAILAFGLYLEFRVLPRTKFGKRMFLSAAVTGQSGANTPETTAALLGQTGEAATPLAPTGIVLLGGRKYEASSRGDFIDSGARVIVRGGDNFKLIVEKAS